MWFDERQHSTSATEECFFLLLLLTALLHVAELPLRVIRNSAAKAMCEIDNKVILQLCASLRDGQRISGMDERVPLFLDNVYAEFEKNTALKTNDPIIVELARTLTSIDRLQWSSQPHLFSTPAIHYFEELFERFFGRCRTR